MSKYCSGQVFEILAPFTFDMVDVIDWECEIPMPTTVPSWQPGFTHEFGYGGESEMVCHGFGHVIYTVIDFHALPKPYPARVFYTRKFRDPEGREFGKTKLNTRSAAAFTRLVSQHVWPLSSRCDDIKLVGKPPLPAP